jgi:cell division protein ZapA (FtsZ GTPase activity inhibitor)
VKSETEEPLELALGVERFRLRAEKSVHARLQAVAETVNLRLEELRRGGGVLTQSRAALMAAFQFAYELDELDAQSDLSGEDRKSVAEKIENLIARIDEGLRDAEF